MTRFFFYPPRKEKKKRQKVVSSFFFSRKDPPPNGRKADSLQPLPTFKLLRKEEPSGSSASGHLGSEKHKKTGRNEKKFKGRCKRRHLLPSRRSGWWINIIRISPPPPSHFPSSLKGEMIRIGRNKKKGNYENKKLWRESSFFFFFRRIISSTFCQNNRGTWGWTSKADVDGQLLLVQHLKIPISTGEKKSEKKNLGNLRTHFVFLHRAYTTGEGRWIIISFGMEFIDLLHPSLLME